MSIRNSGANSAYLWINSAFDHNAAFTWHIKAKITTDENRNTTFACTSGDTAQYDGDYFRTSSDGTTVRAAVALDNSFASSGGTNLSTGTYYNLTLVRSSATSLKIYVDGTVANTVTTDVTSRDGAGALFLTVQAMEDAATRTGSLNGCIAYSIIWAGVALSDSEITSQQDYGHPVVQTGSVWNYSVFTGGNYNDLSGNGRHWTAAGAITDEADPTIKYSLAAAQTEHNHTVAVPALTQHNVLAAADTTHNHTVATPALTQHNILAAAEASHGHAVDGSGALTQHNVLVAAETTHNHTVDNATLYYSPSGVAIYGDSTSHGHTAGNAVLIPHFVLAAQDSRFAHTVEGFDIVQHNILVAASTSHGHTVDSAAVALHIAAAEARHGHTAAGAVLTQHHVLAPNNSRLRQTVANAALSILLKRTIAASTAARFTLASGAAVAVQTQAQTSAARQTMSKTTELN